MNRLELPCCAASSTRCMYLSGITPQGYCNSPGDEPTTLIPAARMRMTSAIASGRRVSPIAQYTMQSGPAAIRASRLSTAAMPVDTSSPASSPASLPTFSGVETHSPVSSNCGLVISSISASRPTFPVATCATRIAIDVLHPLDACDRPPSTLVHGESRRDESSYHVELSGVVTDRPVQQRHHHADHPQRGLRITVRQAGEFGREACEQRRTGQPHHVVGADRTEHRLAQRISADKPERHRNRGGDPLGSV